MSDRSDNLLHRKANLKKHIREAMAALRRDGLRVVGLYHQTNGHFAVAILVDGGREVRVEVPSSPRARSGWLRRARALAGAA
jgi:crotonobetainyl-CoA:carnitine CoA-transferase CaiB-like acyl-CoA transferase